MPKPSAPLEIDSVLDVDPGVDRRHRVDTEGLQLLAGVVAVVVVRLAVAVAVVAGRAPRRISASLCT